MSKYASLVASIAANPKAHAVNRSEKMERTLDVMCDNMAKKSEQYKSGVSRVDDSRGYGRKNIRMGD